jgi:filamentous hemagglutinin family protein
VIKNNSALFLLTLIGIAISTHTAIAQTYQPSNRTPVADSTLSTQVSGNGNNFNITGGVNKGRTLFHSFTDFSIPTNGQANFINPVGNLNIITRVTGNSFSDINGLINTNGANFFLLNPNGIVFGTNAQLNVGRAFVGSTANSIDLVDAGGRNYNFGINKAGDGPLLSVDPNVAFNPARLIIGGTITGSKGIENYGTLTTNNQSQYIGLIGGNVTSKGGQIIARGGRVDIGGLNTSGAVTIGNKELIFSGNNLIFSDISLTDTVIDVSVAQKLGTIAPFINDGSSSQSNINISGNNVAVSLTDLLAGLGTNSGIQTVPSGDINISAMGTLILDRTLINNVVESGAEGQFGNIKINAGSLIGYFSNISAGINQGAKGSGGNIDIKTKVNLAITNSSIDTSTFGEGDTGEITINANGDLFLNESQIFSEVGVNGVGNSKGINIDVGELNLTNRSLISSATFQSALVNGKGNAGDIALKTGGDLNITNSFIYSDSFGSGDAGKIGIDVRGKLRIDNSSIINSTYSRLVDKNGAIVANENFGIITVLVPNQEYFSTFIKITGKWPIVTGNTSIGNSQSIKIEAGELDMINNSNIISETGGRGNAGDIKIGTIGNTTISNSTIVSNISRYGEGKTGKISIDTGGKLILNKSEIQSVVAGGIGDSQGIKIRASELNIINNSSISSQTVGQGNAGDIEIFTIGDTIISDSLIYSSSNSLEVSPTALPLSLFFPVPDLKGIKYSAGNIDISSKGLLMNNGDIISASETGRGGNININLSDKLLLKQNQKNQSQFSTISTNAGINYKTVVNNGDGSAFYFEIEGTGISFSRYVLGGGTFDYRNTGTSDRESLIKNNKNASREYFNGSGNGGNITISSPLIITLPGNNDITANAFQGNGGNINIISQGLFGIGYRIEGQESPFTNDITASSTFGQSGTVNINTPGIDPGKDTTQLPTVPTDASNQISQVCGATTRQNKLTVTGRGGLPPIANDPLTSDVVWQDARAASSQPAVSSTKYNLGTLVPPAVGWVFDGKGKATLIAAGSPGQPTGTRVACPNVASE